MSIKLDYDSQFKGNGEMQKPYLTVLIVFALFTIPAANAFDELSVDIKQIDSKDWQLKGASLSLSEIHKESQQLVLSIKQLSLPEPFKGVTLFDIQCHSFSWQENKIVCQQGQAKFNSEILDSSLLAFSFSITEKQSHFSIQNLKFAKGTLSLKAREVGKKWFVSIKTHGIQLQSIKHFLAKFETDVEELNKGQVNADIQLSGNTKGLNKLLIKTVFKNMSLQANDGRLVTDSLNMDLELLAKLKGGVWQWENRSHIKQGELYIDPVYLEIKNEPLSLKTQGHWDKQGKLQVHQFNLNHSQVFELNTDSLIKVKPVFSVDTADISLIVKNLDKFSSQYLSPFAEQTAFEGIKLKGQLESEFEITDTVINQLSVDFSNLMVIDDKKRFAINNAKGVVNWSVNPDFLTSSWLSWQQLKIRAIPIDEGQLKFLAKNKSIMLLEPSSVPFLGGVIDIEKFNWHQQIDDEPKVYFKGGLNDVSLEQLSNALDWTPLSGNISGYIPGVEYENKTLSVNGDLKIKVFDGLIKINKLASSGLFTDFSRFYMSMEVDNLDLNAITQKFKVGGIEGRLSGFVNNLYLENWEPVTFYAWLGTPENDDSKHRISQKAVENIASIGGGGAADIISKGFLRFFDTFGYDRLGFGCYLYQGVCQLMGVESVEQGYYIIKGGGIPRINVIGYNLRLNWKVLIERLSRISVTDDVVIE